MFNERDIESVLNRADITDVVQRRIGQLSHGKACCPFHKEKTPSFHVNARTQSWHCFGGCPQGDNGGDAISFVMKYDHLSFPEAVKTLAKEYGVRIEEHNEPRTAEEIAQDKKREAMRILNEWACQFYVEAIHADNDKAKFAYKYATDSRGWGITYVEENRIGFADAANDSLYQAARTAGHSIELMIEMGLLNKNDRGEIYDFYRNRLMIPIKDRFRHVIGFTARDLTGTSKAKYMNSKDSDLYHKKGTIFGIDNAISQARKEDIFYLVEGAPDAIKLQAIGITNTVAPLGGAWQAEQFALLKPHAHRVCFIPDADPAKPGEKMGAGKKFVCTNGLTALKAGLGVIVKEIPLTEDGEKQDPDSFINSPAALEAIESQDFIVWYGAMKFQGAETAEVKSEVVNELVQIVAYIHDDVKEQMLLKQLQKFYPDKAMWKSALSKARKADKEKKISSRQGQMINRELLDKYGFYAADNCYFAIGDRGEQQWSNFTLLPMYHIKDSVLSKRLYKIKNNRGAEDVIELKQEDLCSLQKFKMRIESLGNYIWLAKEEQLTKLKLYLYEQTETAIEITQLGWQQQGFWAFGNGAQADDQWVEADEYGIVRLGDKGNWYLPGSSKLYKNDKQLFAFERQFVHMPLSAISLHDVSQKIINVFGDNGKVGICFLLATLFRDIIFGFTNHFPILNLFGPVGTGKSGLAEALMSFFIADNKATTLSNTSVPSLGIVVAQCANALVHIDEYKNDIEYQKVDFLKNIWEGLGRSRASRESDYKKREQMAMDSGIILSGQEMPTADIALFTRVLFLHFSVSAFSPEAAARFEELKTLRKIGFTHLTLQILKHRAKVEAEFISNYKTAKSDIIDNLRGLDVIDRIRDNWVIPLAILRTLGGVLDIPIDYKDMMRVCIEHIQLQNKENTNSNELSHFWDAVAFLFQDGVIFRDSDFRVKYVSRWKTDSGLIEWSNARPVLFLRKNRVFMLYRRNGRQVATNVLPAETLSYYLEHSPEFIGTKKSVRFKNIIDGRHETMTVIDSTTGAEKLQNTDTIDRAYCFDYNMLKEKYGLNLEVIATSGIEDIEEPKPSPREPRQKELWED